jgi:sporulation protein YlmC with PRC-barrel domain
MNGEESMTDTITRTSTQSNNALISSARVEGTHVYNAAGEKLGTVDAIMIDKYEGKVAYAVMSFGGFLGIGEQYHPLPWQSLDYDERKDGYVVNMTTEQLKAAPTLGKDEYDRLKDRIYGAAIYSHYGHTPYWIPIA